MRCSHFCGWVEVKLAPAVIRVDGICALNRTEGTYYQRPTLLSPMSA